MKQRRILLKKTVGQVIATMAVAIATVTANSTCGFWIYEDKESAKLKELRKF
jgi:cyclic lactone autoinducer peptide